VHFLSPAGGDDRLSTHKFLNFWENCFILVVTFLGSGRKSNEFGIVSRFGQKIGATLKQWHVAPTPSFSPTIILYH
jgi:hypothetical protein